MAKRRAFTFTFDNEIAEFLDSLRTRHSNLSAYVQVLIKNHKETLEEEKRIKARAKKRKDNKKVKITYSDETLPNKIDLRKSNLPFQKITRLNDN